MRVRRHSAFIIVLALTACAPEPPPQPRPPATEGAARPTGDTSGWQRAPTPAASTLRGTNLAPSGTQGSGVSGRRLVR